VKDDCNQTRRLAAGEPTPVSARLFEVFSTSSAVLASLMTTPKGVLVLLPVACSFDRAAVRKASRSTGRTVVFAQLHLMGASGSAVCADREGFATLSGLEF
jgi:hypothetical protein